MKEKTIPVENIKQLVEHYKNKPIPVTLLRLLFEDTETTVTKKIKRNEKHLYGSLYLFATSEEYLNSTFSQLISESLKFYISNGLSDIQKKSFLKCCQDIEIIKKDYDK